MPLAASRDGGEGRSRSQRWPVPLSHSRATARTPSPTRRRARPTGRGRPRSEGPPAAPAAEQPDEDHARAESDPQELGPPAAARLRLVTSAIIAIPGQTIRSNRRSPGCRHDAVGEGPHLVDLVRRETDRPRLRGGIAGEGRTRSPRGSRGRCRRTARREARCRRSGRERGRRAGGRVPRARGWRRAAREVEEARQLGEAAAVPGRARRFEEARMRGGGQGRVEAVVVARLGRPGVDRLEPCLAGRPPRRPAATRRCRAATPGHGPGAGIRRREARPCVAPPRIQDAGKMAGDRVRVLLQAPEFDDDALEDLLGSAVVQAAQRGVVGAGERALAGMALRHAQGLHISVGALHRVRVDP